MVLEDKDFPRGQQWTLTRATEVRLLLRLVRFVDIIMKDIQPELLHRNAVFCYVILCYIVL